MAGDCKTNLPAESTDAQQAQAAHDGTGQEDAGGAGEGAFFEIHIEQAGGQSARPGALLLFVGIPLPGTGAWTGSLVAAVLRMRIWQAFLVITVGVLVSGFITGGIAYGLFTALA